MRRNWTFRLEHRRALRLALLAFAVASAFAASSAQAAIVTVGSPLSGMFISGGLSSVTTVANTSLPEPGAHVSSPVTGTVVQWRITGASGGPFKLRVLTPVSGTNYTGAGTSSPQTPGSTATQTFSTNLPINAGQVVGLDDTNGTDKIGVRSTVGVAFIDWIPPLADASTRAYTGTNTYELGFNADVQPLPSVSAVTPASGPTTGGTTVTIGGQDFLGTTAVSFGGTPASSFTVLSDNLLTAVTPAGSAGPVDVVVKNPGQSAVVAADRFTYTLPAVKCVVPKLKGKKPKAAKAALRAANCALGKVKKHGHKHGKVKKQSPSAGTVLAAGSKVGVTLGK